MHLIISHTRRFFSYFSTVPGQGLWHFYEFPPSDGSIYRWPYDEELSKISPFNNSQNWISKASESPSPSSSSSSSSVSHLLLLPFCSSTIESFLLFISRNSQSLSSFCTVLVLGSKFLKLWAIFDWLELPIWAAASRIFVLVIRKWVLDLKVCKVELIFEILGIIERKWFGGFELKEKEEFGIRS